MLEINYVKGIKAVFVSLSAGYISENPEQNRIGFAGGGGKRGEVE